ncbi:hypothetical protein BsWGS_05160 [Bradybaena similaris]
MPRKVTKSDTKSQATISKFFTSATKEQPKVGAKRVKIATDVNDDFQVVSKSGKKQSSTATKDDDGDDAPKSKKLCGQSRSDDVKQKDKTKQRNTKQTESTSSKQRNTKQTESTSSKQRNIKQTESTSSKLKNFEFEESGDSKQKRDIFKPRNKLPDIIVNEDVEIMDQGSSDSEDNTVSPLLTHRNGTSRASTSASQTSTAIGKKVVKYTPLEQQFVDIKAQNPDVILFVQSGYKYRFFGEDAEIAARILKIYCRMDHNFMTASIPVHRLFVHVRRIVAAGYKVGIVKQTETAHLKAAGSNKSAPFTRQMTALYTKSTLIGEDVDPLCDSESDYDTSWQSNHYLMCLSEQQANSGTSCQIGFVCVDVSTGEVLYDEFRDSTTYSELDTRIAHLQPVEILIPSDISQKMKDIIMGITALSEKRDDRIRLEIIDSDVFKPTKAVSLISQFYSNDQSKLQDALNLPKLVINCLAALLEYLKSFHLERVLSVTSNLCRFSQRTKHMLLSGRTLHSLEVFSNSCDGTEKGSLFWVLNHTCTKFGARLLRKWLTKPLLVVEEIQARLDAVQELVDGSSPGLTSLQQTMAKLPDLERGLCSIFHKKCSVNEFCSVVKALEKVKKELCSLHMPVKSSLLQSLLSNIPEHLENISEYSSQINEKAAKENDMSNLFVDETKFPVIGNRKEEMNKIEKLVQEHLKEIRLALKQPSLKYGMVNQIEFLVEVRNSQTNLVPSDWILISSTKAVSRYHTPYVAKHYRKLNELREQLLLDVNVCWQEFLEQFSSQFTRYQRAVTALASLDCLMSLATTAGQGSFCRPHLDDDRAHIEIKQGRHPIINALSLGQGQFVPNDTHLDADGQRVMVISGPNMGGKSSYIRQVALISIMAQIGSYVPAESASLGVIDAIYTRMGASDEIFQGRSTFMVELQEAAEIMAEATDKSLVILDELGRGTSTYDGVAIAHASLEYFIQKYRCLVLFVTHFPMMSEFQLAYHDQVHNFHMAFLLHEGEKDNLSGVEPVTFLYQLSDGAAAESYGLNVARMAEIPDDILSIAARKSREISRNLVNKVRTQEAFVSLYRATEEDIIQALKKCAQCNTLD